MIVPDEDIVCVVASETASDQASQPVSSVRLCVSEVSYLLVLLVSVLVADAPRCAGRTASSDSAPAVAFAGRSLLE